MIKNSLETPREDSVSFRGLGGGGGEIRIREDIRSKLTTPVKAEICIISSESTESEKKKQPNHQTKQQTKQNSKQNSSRYSPSAEDQCRKERQQVISRDEFHPGAPLFCSVPHYPLPTDSFPLSPFPPPAAPQPRLARGAARPAAGGS